mgnify:CR=1 FL=1
MPQYIAIDLKSFYASVECVERGLDPLTTNLVVADESRTEKTICLAVSPSLKKYGIPGRARLFEVVQKVKQVNRSRKFLLRVFDLLVQFTVFLTVETLLQGFHVVVHCGTSADGTLCGIQYADL